MSFGHQVKNTWYSQKVKLLAEIYSWVTVFKMGLKSLVGLLFVVSYSVTCFLRYNI